MSSRKQVIYLSSTETGRALLAWLRTQPCDVVLANTDNTSADHLPPCDLGLGFLYVHKIPASEFIEPHKWVNFHPGPLPEFRGRDLAYHAIMQGCDQFGATIHYMDAQFDTGEIIEVVRFPIESGDTAGDLVLKSHEQLASLFRKYVPLLLQGKVPSHPQPAGAYYRKAVIDDEIHLSEEQARKVRAVTVHPRFTAHTIIGGRKYLLAPVEPGGPS